MKKTRQRVITARRLAASVLLKWEGFSQSRRMPLAHLTEDFLENTGPWSARDRALVRELVFGGREMVDTPGPAHRLPAFLQKEETFKHSPVTFENWGLSDPVS